MENKAFLCFIKSACFRDKLRRLSKVIKVAKFTA